MLCAICLQIALSFTYSERLPVGTTVVPTNRKCADNMFQIGTSYLTFTNKCAIVAIAAPIIWKVPDVRFHDGT